jgi:cell wall assembly regulator SMI1
VDVPVEESWRRIAGWLGRHAPVTAAAIRPAARAAETFRVTDAVGRPLPEDLLRWWELMDGIADADYHAGTPIPPFYLPLPVADVHERFASLSRFADQECCGADGAHATTAGQPSFGFCTATVPICRDSGGDALVADLRDGTRRGCVMEWTAEGGYRETAWTGTAAMLADVADRLDDPAQTEVVGDGVLQWT